MRKYLSEIKLEYIALPLLAALSLVTYHLHYFEYLLLPISATIGALLFIIFNRFFANNELTLNRPQLSGNKQHTLRLTLSILFCIFYALSFLALLQGFYTKTPLYYISIALCAGVIAVDILFVNTKTQGYLNLLKSFLLVLNITLSNQILFPYGIGLPDSNTHIFSQVIPIINSGHILLTGAYSHFPGHHILVAANSLLTGLDPRMLYYYLGGFVMSLGLLFVFLIGRKFVNLKFGLLAALIYTSCGYLMSWAAHPTHMTYTYFLAIAIFAITLYIYHKRRPEFSVLFIIIATTMIFSHHLSAAVILIMLAAMLSIELINRIKAPHYEFKIPLLAALFFVALFAQWMYYSGTISTFANIIEVYRDAFTQEAATRIALTTGFAKLPLRTLFLNEIGSGILLMLSTVGFLHFFAHGSPFKKFVIAIVVALMLLIGIDTLLKESYLESHRMYSFMQEFSLVFLASCAIIWMLNNFRKSFKPLLIVLLICLSFFSLASLVHGEETGIFKGDRAYWKIYETPYERYSAQWGEQYIPISSDISKSWSFRCPVSNLSADKLPLKELEDAQGKEILVIDSQELPEGTFTIFSRFDIDIGFPREAYTAGKYYFGSGTRARLDQSAIESLEENDKLYHNGIVGIYHKSYSLLV